MQRFASYQNENLQTATSSQLNSKMDDDGRAVAIRIIMSHVLSACRRLKNLDSEDWLGLVADTVLTTISTLTITTYIFKALYKEWQNYQARRRIENGDDERDLRNRENLKKFKKLIPIRWPIPGESDEIDEQLQKNTVDLEDYNKRFSTEKSSLESILFYGKKFIRLIWIDIRYRAQRRIENGDDEEHLRRRKNLRKFYKLLPIRWPIPGTSDEIDEQLQKNNVDLEDYNKRFSTEKSPLEFILFHAKKFIRKNWIDTVRLVVVPVCSVIYVRLTGNEPNNPYDVLLSCDQFLLSILLHAVFFRWLRNHLAELRGEE
ncbi:hypothetical protein CAEBREN_21937 [Caenorhabditis brenneri]|uniref:Uncharacterized protein n=1 Tax=Caenorhabditis brenneri TaxID=135651 RepID=G0MQB4_CAEBE|nr:hypothetical protein CAEBREN_21937 [Caenorhabditis brenneri]